MTKFHADSTQPVSFGSNRFLATLARTAALVATALWLAGCQRPVDENKGAGSSSPSSAHSANDGHDHKDGDGHDHKESDGHDHKEGDGHDHKAGDEHKQIKSGDI